MLINQRYWVGYTDEDKRKILMMVRVDWCLDSLKQEAVAHIPFMDLVIHDTNALSKAGRVVGERIKSLLELKSGEQGFMTTAYNGETKDFQQDIDCWFGPHHTHKSKSKGVKKGTTTTPPKITSTEAKALLKLLGDNI